MVDRIRSEYDSDFPKELHQFKSQRTANHQHEIRCNICGKLYFVDGETFKKIEKQMKYDLDNQFLCIKCEHEFQDAAFE